MKLCLHDKHHYKTVFRENHGIPRLEGIIQPAWYILTLRSTLLKISLISHEKAVIPMSLKHSISFETASYSLYQEI